MNLDEIEEAISETVAELVSVEDELEILLQRQEKLLKRKKSLEYQRDEVKCSLPVNSKLISQSEAQFTDWEKGDFPWNSSVIKTLKSTFNIDQFRPLQSSCINATLSGKDTFLIMPTGAGKSLSYQLPAVLSPGLTLVVSPLVSLMEDQLLAVKNLGIDAATLNASSSQSEVSRVHSALITKGDGLKILYVTPEKIAKSKRLMSKLEKCYEIGHFSRIVIDEVHCASQWGHDFRPDYKKLGILKRQFPSVPLLGLTATATAKVVEDVKQILSLEECLLFRASYNRANLVYEVRLKKSGHKAQMESLCALIKRRFPSMSGIVYCLSRKDTEEVASDLCQQGIKAACYHADLTHALRTRVHTKWLDNSVKVIVATIAFGMGIDKPDVRFVIHHSLSKSIENYYQESGRAGRDGGTAHCILYFRAADCFRLSAMVFTNHTGLQNLYAMLKYCLNKAECRRAVLARSFGDTWKESDCTEACDVCSLHPLATSLSSAHSSVDQPDASFLSTRPQKNKKLYVCSSNDISSECRALVEILEGELSKTKRVTANKLVELWRDRLKKDKKSMEVEDCEEVLLRALVGNILKEEFHFTPYSTISYMGLGSRAEALKRSISKINIRVRIPDKMTSSGEKEHTLIHENNVFSSCSGSQADGSHKTSKANSAKLRVLPRCCVSSSTEEKMVNDNMSGEFPEGLTKRSLPTMMLKLPSEEFISGAFLPAKRRKSDFDNEQSKEDERDIIELLDSD